ncbi:MAG: hypothetical protein NTV93_21035 [Verrucomicrobia bacterium]|nr:hypothetical protein [Verrucomicrobiota bacterium]
MIGVCHADLWEPWRKDAKVDLNSPGYTISNADPVLFKPWADLSNGSVEGVTPQSGTDPEAGPLLFATYEEVNKAPGASLDIANISLTKTEGCELAFRFRIANVPAKLEKSHALATFQLKGPGRSDAFYLHIYRPPKAGSTKTGFMLNHLAQKGQWERAAVTRGAILPAEAVPLDRAWHTVRIAWRIGQMEVYFDNLLVLRAFDTSIDYRSFSILKIQPGGEALFKSLDLSAIELRVVTFNEN